MLRYLGHVYVYLHQAEDNLIDFSLWINNSATLAKPKSFQLKYFTKDHRGR